MTCTFPGESDAQTAAAVSQRGVRLLLREPDCARVNDEAVLDQSEVAEFHFALLGRAMKTLEGCRETCVAFLDIWNSQDIDFLP